MRFPQLRWIVAILGLSTACIAVDAYSQQASTGPPPNAKPHQARKTTFAYKMDVNVGEAKGLAWTGDMLRSLQDARKDGKLVFVTFVAAVDVNSLLNFETLGQPIIAKELNHFRNLALFVDAVPEKFFNNEPTFEQRRSEAEANYKFQTKVFDTVAVPLCAVIRPVSDDSFEIVARYEGGLIKNTDNFREFLSDARSLKDEKKKAK